MAIFSVLYANFFSAACLLLTRCEKHSILTPEPVYVRQSFIFCW